MIIGPASCALFTAISWQTSTIQAPTHAQPGPRIAVLVASNDKAIHSKLVQLRRGGLDLTKLQKAFGDSRYVIEELSGGGAILLDRRLPLIQDLSIRAQMAEALVAKLGENGEVRIGDLEGAGREATSGHMDRWFPSQLRAPDVKIDDVVVAVTPCLYVSVSGPDGRSMTIELPHRGEKIEKAHRAVEKTPLRTTRPSPEQRAELDSESIATELARGEVTTRFFGPDHSVVPDGLETLGKLLSRVLEEERQRLEKASLALASKLGLGEPGLPARAGFSDLPKNLRDELTGRLRREFRVRGFGSPDEAESFLMNSQTLQIRTSFGLLTCQAPRDPDNRRPGAFTVHDFATLPGGVWPP